MTGIVLPGQPALNETVLGLRAWRDSQGSVHDEARMRRLWASPPADWRSDLLDRHRVMTVLAYIQRHPEQWGQHTYSDEPLAKGCFAGLTVALELEVGVGQLGRVMLARRQTESDIPHLARLLTGMSIAQACAIFLYTWVKQPYGEGLGSREPTFDELVDRVNLVTGVDFHARKPPGAQQRPSLATLPRAPAAPEMVGAAA